MRWGERFNRGDKGGRSGSLPLTEQLRSRRPHGSHADILGRLRAQIEPDVFSFFSYRRRSCSCIISICPYAGDLLRGLVNWASRFIPGAGSSSASLRVPVITCGCGRLGSDGRLNTTLILYGFHHAPRPPIGPQQKRNRRPTTSSLLMPAGVSRSPSSSRLSRTRCSSMPVRPNRYHSGPAVRQAVSSIASMFGPPDGSKATWAKTSATLDEARTKSEAPACVGRALADGDRRPHESVRPLTNG